MVLMTSLAEPTPEELERQRLLKEVPLSKLLYNATDALYYSLIIVFVAFFFFFSFFSKTGGAEL